MFETCCQGGQYDKVDFAGKDTFQLYQISVMSRINITHMSCMQSIEFLHIKHPA